MTKQKTTKKALLASVLSLMLCCVMLIGTTFAWFTDSVTSSRNTIQSGNLDVELYYSVIGEDGKWTEYQKVTKNTKIFNYDLWEPGYTAVAKFKIANEGSLALKYQLTADVYSETPGQTKDGEEIELSDYLLYGVTEDISVLEDRATAAAAATNAFDSFEVKASALEKETSVEVGMVITMPTTVGNEANHDGKNVPSIEFGINLIATQEMKELDSFDNTYDKDAFFYDVWATPETIDDVLATVEAGTVIGLAEGYYDEIVITQDDLTLVSQSAVVGFTNLNAHDGIILDGLIFDQTGAKQTYTFRTGNVQKATGYVANITGDTNSPKAANNITIKNCTFTNTSGIATVADEKYAPIHFDEQGAATERATNITITNCKFECNATQYITLNYMADGKVKIANNVFGGGVYGTTHNTINASGNAADWTISGNEFNNWNVQKTAIGSSKQGSNKVTWTIKANEFNNDDASVVLALKNETYTNENTVIKFSDNTALDGNAVLVVASRNAEDDENILGYKIQLSAGVELVYDEGILVAIIKDGEYYVSDANGLAWVAKEVNKVGQYAANLFDDKTIKLTDDIDLNGMEWTPIGDFKFSATQFKGTFDGQGHTVSNFQITKKTSKDDSNKSSYGFFGNVGGTVKNLTIDDANICSYAYVGALVGRLNDGEVINCHVKDSSVECTYWQAGGMIGQLNDGCVVSNCTITNSSVTGASAIGGLVGPITATNANDGSMKTLLFENCSVIDCQIIQKGSFGTSYDVLFGAMFADVDVADNTTNINECIVKNTTVKGSESDVLYNTLSGSAVYVDGVKVDK